MKSVNYIIQMNEAFLKLSEEENITAAHLSLYWTLFQLWNLGKFQPTVSINRADTMNLARIGSKTTYYKVLKDLEARGYIKYISSKNPMKGSQIEMIVFKTGLSHVPNVGHVPHRHDHDMYQNRDNSWDNSVPFSGQQVGPSINSINNKPIKHVNKKVEEKANSFRRPNPEREVQKDEGESFNRSAIPPSIDEVKEFFISNGSYGSEGENFYNYFQSNGWLVGGKAKMKDWNAAARNWIKRAQNFNSSSKANNRLHTNNDKDYSMPL